MAHKRGTPKLKHRKVGTEFPMDFWNYDINPVTGWKTYKWKNNDKYPKKK